MSRFCMSCIYIRKFQLFTITRNSINFIAQSNNYQNTRECNPLLSLLQLDAIGWNIFAGLEHVIRVITIWPPPANANLGLNFKAVKKNLSVYVCIRCLF